MPTDRVAFTLPFVSVLDNITVRAKVFLGPGLIMLVLLLVSVACALMLDAGGKRLRTISQGAFPAYQRAAEADDAVNTVEIGLQHTLSVAANENDRARLQKVAAPVRVAIEHAAALLDTLARQSSDAVALGKLSRTYRGLAIEVIETAGSDAATATLLMSTADFTFAALISELDQRRSAAQTVSKELTEQAAQAADIEHEVLFVTVGLAVVLSLAIMIVTSSAISQPITDLTGTMVAIAGGDLERRVGSLRNRDEIGAMAKAVEVFRRNALTSRALAEEKEREQVLKQQRNQIMQHRTADFGISITSIMAALDASATDMRAAAADMTKAASAVSQDANSTAVGAGVASEDLASVAAAVEEFTASVDEIARQVSAAAHIAKNAVGNAQSGQATMSTLTQAVGHITEVVEVIDAIARQTNLLALNAGIEAARAGKAGNSFAVVAGEVKALASETARATSSIRLQIHAVTSSAADALSAMTGISDIVSRMDKIAAAIASAVAQQTATVRSVSASVQAVSGATSRTTSAMSRLVEVAGAAGDTSYAVLTSANAIGDQAEALRSDVDTFLFAVRNDAPAVVNRNHRDAESQSSVGWNKDRTAAVAA